MTDSMMDIARRWAALLDTDAFDDLPAMMHHRCVYQLPEESLVGPDKIIDSYRDSSVWAHATFDRIEWDSELAIEDDRRVRITFIDITRHNGIDHVYRCQQVITIDNDGLVCHIEHIDIPDEEQKLNAFLARVGIRRSRGNATAE